MLNWIVAGSLRLRFLMLAAAAALIGFGAVQLQQMPVDVFPEFAPPTVEVQTEAIGLSAEEVESLITLGLEELLSGVPWLESTRSRSVTGLSTITLIFKRGTDLIKARQMVQERLTLEYKLPNVATPPVILQPVSSTNRFMLVAISSDKIEPTELSLLARWTIKPRLVGVPGVANVAIWGQRLRQMHVHIQPERLRDARLTQDEIIAAAGDALWLSPLTFLKSSATGAGGWIDNPNQRLGVEHAMPIERPEDMAKVPVTSEPELRLGRAVPLGDVTEVTFSHPPLIGDAFVNGGNGLLLVLEKFPSASVPEVTQRVEEALAELSRGLPGVKIDTRVYRLATYLEDARFHVGVALLLGVVLFALAGWLLLRSWRGALVAGTSIAIALVAALLVLQAAGATLNVMVLAGLLVGLAVVVGQAVMDVEGMTERARPPSPPAPLPAGAGGFAAIVAAARITRGPAVYSLLIVALSVVPILCTGGVFGAFLEPFAIAYLLAVALAFAVALTITPALAALLLQSTFSPRPPGEGPGVRAALRSHHERLLRRVLAAPRGALIAVAVLVAAGAVSWPLLGDSLLPTLREREVVVTTNAPPGTSHAETQRITTRLSRELQGIPGVRSVGAHVGRAVTGDQVVGINSSQIWVSIERSADYEKTVAAIRETIDGYPGIERSLHTYLHNKVNDVLTGESNALVVRVYGPKRDVRQQQADAVRQAIADVRGLVDLRVEGEIEEPHVQVKVDLDAASKADIKPGDVRRASATVFAGIVVGYLFKEQKIFEVVVWGAPSSRESLTGLRDLWIDKSDRTRTRLSDVAEVKIQSTRTVIRHERIAPYIDVVANVSGRDAGTVAGEVDARLAKMSFPLEHRAELLGEAVERDKARRRIAGIVVASAIGIFLLLQACFASWGLALAAFGAILAAVAGGVVAAAVAAGGSTLGTLIGLLGFVAIAARNAIVLFDRYRLPGTGTDVEPGVELAVRGASDRLATIVAGNAAIIALMLPFTISATIPGMEIAHPIAVAMLGGTVASALVSLFVLPALWLRTPTVQSPEFAEAMT